MLQLSLWRAFLNLVALSGVSLVHVRLYFGLCRAGWLAGRGWMSVAVSDGLLEDLPSFTLVYASLWVSCEPACLFCWAACVPACLYGWVRYGMTS